MEIKNNFFYQKLNTKNYKCFFKSTQVDRIDVLKYRVLLSRDRLISEKKDNIQGKRKKNVQLDGHSTKRLKLTYNSLPLATASNQNKHLNRKPIINPSQPKVPEDQRFPTKKLNDSQQYPIDISESKAATFSLNIVGELEDSGRDVHKQRRTESIVADNTITLSTHSNKLSIENEKKGENFHMSYQ